VKRGPWGRHGPVYGTARRTPSGRPAPSLSSFTQVPRRPPAIYCHVEKQRAARSATALRRSALSTPGARATTAGRAPVDFFPSCRILTTDSNARLSPSSPAGHRSSNPPPRSAPPPDVDHTSPKLATHGRLSSSEWLPPSLPLLLLRGRCLGASSRLLLGRCSRRRTVF